MTIKNHFSTLLYKALLVCKKDFAYECSESGDIFFDGYTLLCMIYVVVKPTVIINVKDLQMKMEKLTILICDNNFRTSAPRLKIFSWRLMPRKALIFAKMISCQDPIVLMVAIGG